MYTDSLG